MKKTVAFSILMLFILSGIDKADAQNNAKSEFTVSGIVTDEDQLPVIGLVVSVKRDGKIAGGTTTDIDGHYSVNVRSESDSLVFSYLGYITQSYIVGGKRRLNIEMQSSTTDLDEVVVTGYQTISRERATGSFSKVTSATLDKQRLSNLSTLLEGQVAGFTGGLLRGTTSMYGAAQPLYVVDGFPIENVRYDGSTSSAIEGLPELNMEDIESITVLKDAAATSIYGARAANGGVVVIITKKAAKGKVQVSFSSTFTFSPYSYYKDGLTDSADMIDIEREWAANNSSLQGTDASTYAQRMLDSNIYPTQEYLLF